MITVYSKPNCHFCDKAKAYLTNKGIPFEVIDVMADSEALDFIKGNGHRTVPQLYLRNKGEDGKIVAKLFVENGFEGLSKLSKEDIERRIAG